MILTTSMDMYSNITPCAIMGSIVGAATGTIASLFIIEVIIESGEDIAIGNAAATFGIIGFSGGWINGALYDMMHHSQQHN